MNPYAGEFDAFAARVEAGERLHSDSEKSMLRALAMAQAAYASAKSGKFVEVDRMIKGR